MDIHNYLFFMVFSLFSPVFTDEDYAQVTACCYFKGPGFKDIEYILSARFNKKLIQQYNSTRGNWTGFTAMSIEYLKAWNKDPYDAMERAFEKNILCTKNIEFIQQLGNISSVPTVKLNSVKHPPMLVCSAYNFYPKQIRLTWLRNGQEVTSSVSFSEVMPDGDLYYQIHSYLEPTPTKGEKMTCMVEHLTLSEPMLQVWDPSLPVSEWIKIAVGLFGLILGFVMLSSGFIYYKKNSKANFTLCQAFLTGSVLVPLQDVPEVGAT
ncbi:class II histocompatibility antigen, B-L beta chain [Etheostoma spectabile]|uniref:class II histocompatibility antigen, B-L beta chain n=1 Tax=Etheostoma spectabile TaxID=54343 RepID=UPI0013AFDE91|nr:class II histocompatibility antigen, B-L beta chain-like [Etheostoma spectabile]